jgi:Domain of unknown function (DUF4372)
MNKSTFFSGQPIFTQLLRFIPKDTIFRIATQYNADRYCKRFTTYEHLVTILYSIFNNCNSLREVTTGVLAPTKLFTYLDQCGGACANRRLTKLLICLDQGGGKYSHNQDNNDLSENGSSYGKCYRQDTTFARTRNKTGSSIIGPGSAFDIFNTNTNSTFAGIKSNSIVCNGN